ncbi:hypothetical protein AA313_de0201967 [Arthrobotrys entomopaga]|nr:hypothetical protein AA313_de0201967 [Arthrobotrys entomopaga]
MGKKQEMSIRKNRRACDRCHSQKLLCQRESTSESCFRCLRAQTGCRITSRPGKPRGSSIRGPQSKGCKPSRIRAGPPLQEQPTNSRSPQKLHPSEEEENKSNQSAIEEPISPVSDFSKDQFQFQDDIRGYTESNSSAFLASNQISCPETKPDVVQIQSLCHRSSPATPPRTSASRVLAPSHLDLHTPSPSFSTEYQNQQKSCHTFTQPQALSECPGSIDSEMTSDISISTPITDEILSPLPSDWVITMTNLDTIFQTDYKASQDPANIETPPDEIPDGEGNRYHTISSSETSQSFPTSTSEFPISQQTKLSNFTSSTHYESSENPSLPPALSSQDNEPIENLHPSLLSNDDLNILFFCFQNKVHPNQSSHMPSKWVQTPISQPLRLTMDFAMPWLKEYFEEVAVKQPLAFSRFMNNYSEPSSTFNTAKAPSRLDILAALTRIQSGWGNTVGPSPIQRRAEIFSTPSKRDSDISTLVTLLEQLVRLGKGLDGIPPDRLPRIYRQIRTDSSSGNSDISETGSHWNYSEKPGRRISMSPRYIFKASSVCNSLPHPLGYSKFSKSLISSLKQFPAEARQHLAALLSLRQGNGEPRNPCPICWKNNHSVVNCFQLFPDKIPLRKYCAHPPR